jgi:hypothetical protein
MTFSILTTISQPIRYCSSVARLQSELEKLLAGQAGVGIAKKLGVSRMNLQRLIAGKVSMAYALGRLQPQAQELRNRMECEGAASSSGYARKRPKGNLLPVDACPLVS